MQHVPIKVCRELLDAMASMLTGLKADFKGSKEKLANVPPDVVSFVENLYRVARQQGIDEMKSAMHSALNTVEEADA